MESSPIQISERAILEIKNILTNKNIPGQYSLRIGVKGGGCGGANFFVGFDTVKDDDNVYFFEDLKVLIDKKHILYLLDVELDFEERKDEQGFVFLKPDVKLVK